jgi:hypothetical protein
MSVGQTLVLSCTPEPLTVGANFFQCLTETQKQRKLLLIRLSQAGPDRLYPEGENRLTIEDL